MLKYALLGFLSYNPMSGYELKHLMDSSTSNFWHAELSQIYATLKTLEEKGLVASVIVPQEDKPDRREYTLTAKGLEALDRWLKTPDVEIYPSKEPFLLKLFFSARADKEFILAQLRIQRDLHQALLDEYKSSTVDLIAGIAEQAPHLRKDALLWDATRRSGEILTEAIIRWLDETLEMVSEKF